MIGGFRGSVSLLYSVWLAARRLLLSILFVPRFLGRLFSPAHDQNFRGQTNAAVGGVFAEGFDDFTFEFRDLFL